MDMNQSVRSLKGVGEKTAEKLAKAGIETINDLIGYYPSRYETYSEPGTMADKEEGRIISIRGTLERQLTVRRIGRMSITAGRLISKDEIIPVNWFNMPFLRGSILPGKEYVLRGRVKSKGKTKTLQQPQVFDPEEYEIKSRVLQPVYPLVNGVTVSMLRRLIGQVLDQVSGDEDVMPEEMRRENILMPIVPALREIHFPQAQENLLSARRRLVFDEFLRFIFAVRRLKEEREENMHSYELLKGTLAQELINSLPYQLTGAQMRVWKQIEQDMTSRKVMARLVQGDVGSGKTIVAFLALLMAAENGAQGALMVPTEILARQHYDAYVKLSQALSKPCMAVLLTGAMTAAQKREARKKIESGEASVIIGTHALIQEKVTYHKLVLVITDEQHRFGVKQREALSYKGEQPHTIVMSATPIPRTLAVIMYGDLDVSVIDELPANRLPIKNCVVGTSWRQKAYRFIEKEVAAGHQAYVICPLVDSSEMIEAENVTDYAVMLQEQLDPSIRIGVLHGKMKNDEKDAVMQQFLENDIQVLVSTTVVEVGVNVPNATVMMIENAERFGLAQLHQLRGRTGRGSDQSYCIMISADDNEATKKRLDILAKSNDGFEIASKDLQLRGPGDLLGVRQSGEMQFVLADVFQDADIMQRAGDAADQVLNEKFMKENPAYEPLLDYLTQYAEKNAGNLNI